MTYALFFLIRPKKNLQELRVGDGFLDLLREPSLWEKQISDRASFGVLEDTNEVKLLFLANILSEYCDAIRECSMDFRISREFFDEWWTIESLQVDEFVEEIEKKIATTPLGVEVSLVDPVFAATCSNFR